MNTNSGAMNRPGVSSNGSQPFEAEDRLNTNDSYPPLMERSSFDGRPVHFNPERMFESARNHRDTYEDDHAFAYNEHRNGYKRDRSYSSDVEDLDDVASGGDRSFNGAFYQDQLREDQLMNFCDPDDGPELDLDFDELHDLVAKIQPKTHLIITTNDATNAQMVNDQSNNVINNVNGEPANTQEQAELNAAFAGERDQCFAADEEEEQNQPDHELDETYHTVEKYDASFDFLQGKPCDGSIDTSNVSIMMNSFGNFNDVTMNNGQPQQSPYTTLINTCDSPSKDQGPMRVTTPLMDQEAIEFQSFQATSETMKRHCSILGNIKRQDSSEYSSAMTVSTPTAISTESNSTKKSSFVKPVEVSSTGASAKQRLLNKKTQLLKAKTPSKKPTRKAIVKNEAKKLTPKEKLTSKRQTKATQKKPNLVPFQPNIAKVTTDQEESKLVGGKEVNTDCQKAPSRRPKKGDRTYYQNFDFFFKRTGFRTMSLFYKLAFKPYFDKWKQNKKRSTILDALVNFSKEEFPGLLEKLTKEAQFEFIELMKLLVLSHRHNKNDDFLKDPLVDFSVVREPMYKYSKQAQDSFFSLSTFAFLYSWFESCPDGRTFATEKFAENSDERHVVRMTTEVTELGNAAINQLAELTKTSPATAQTASKGFLVSQAARQQLASDLYGYIESRKAGWASKNHH